MKPFVEIEKVVNTSRYKNLIILKQDGDYTIIEVVFSNQYFIDAINFVRTKIDKDVRIQINSKIDFQGESFDERVDLSNCDFNNDTLFKFCTFNENVDFINSNFLKTVNFDNSNFIAKTRFHNVKFYDNSFFENTTFQKLVDFYLAEFKETHKFFLTDFLDITIFSNVTFHRQVQFLYNKVGEKSFISFENAKFKQGFDISRANFWCRIQVWGLETVNFPKEYWLYQFDEIEEQNIVNKSLAYKRVRESYRRIKQEFRNENNHIEALKFHEYEMNLYRKGLKEEINKKNRKLEERIILWFNKWSNNFGSSWTKGLFFTLGTTVVFYSLFLLLISNYLKLDCTWNGVGNVIKYFLQFLNIALWDYEPFGIEKFIWGYIALFVGRVFIGYGYYQTIQAFRKYGKN